MNIQNKTVVFLGSSVTHGGGNFSMCDVIAEQTGANVIKWAVPGTTLSTARDKSYVKRMLDVIDTQEKCDLFICQLSTNDAQSQVVELGEMSDSFEKDTFDTDKVFGAIEFIIATVREKWGCPIAFYTSAYFENEKYQTMVDTLQKIAGKWNIGIIDLWNNMEMRAVSEEDRKKYMNDQYHPSRLGYIEWWTPKFIDFIEKL